LTEDPFWNLRGGNFLYRGAGYWPAYWIRHPESEDAPVVAAYHLRLSLEKPEDLVLHVAADERYELFLNGRRVGRGNERGSPDRWFFESYRVSLAAGPHDLAVRVWSLGKRAPHPQMSCGHGLLVCTDPSSPLLPQIATGAGPWRCLRLGGYGFVNPGLATAATAVMTLHLDESNPEFSFGSGEGWTQPVTGGAGRSREGAGTHAIDDRLLEPATLPGQAENRRSWGVVRSVADLPVDPTAPLPFRQEDHLAGEAEEWQGLADGSRELRLPAGTRRRVLFDLADYSCAYYRIAVTGGRGGTVRVAWAEGLYAVPETKGHRKGHRAEVWERYQLGPFDAFHLDGRDHLLEPWWWRCGRYVELQLDSGPAGCVLRALDLHETRYPLELTGELQIAEPKWQALMPLCVRVLQMCAHETYLDCPYYEQNQWLADARLQMLCGYTMQHDNRLPRKALQQFLQSRRGEMLQALFPSKEVLFLPSFSLWYVGMVHDYALWRGEPEFVRSLLPDLRAMVDAFQQKSNADGLVEPHRGWNYVDWVGAPGWQSGIPPKANEVPSGIINWLLVHILGLLADLEEWLGEPELAARTTRRADALAQACTAAFYDGKRGLMCDEPKHEYVSEHAQIMALLSGRLRPEMEERVAQGLLEATGLARTGLFMTHYLFETYRHIGRIDALFQRLAEKWHPMLDLDLKTTPEHEGLTRSDCHAWSAHPLYHGFASILGIRPASPGFQTVRIEPQLGQLRHAHGKLIHPHGWITVDFHNDGEQITGNIELPAGLTGVLRINGTESPLRPRQTVG
jgi:hypothetical protein